MNSKSEDQLYDNPLISVIIPAYNCEKYIGQTLDSVIDQTYNNLEMIVVNDCSTDGTEKIVLEYQKKDGRITYLCNKYNLGVAKTRNYGVKESRGLWIALVDSDDLWSADKLDLQLKFLKENGSFFCCTGRALIDKNSVSLDKYISVRKEISYKDLLKTNQIVCSSILCKREIMSEFPMDHDDTHEDYITWLQITRKYGNVLGLDRPLVKYRFMETTKSGNKFKSAKMQMKAYKYLGITRVKSIIYFLNYIFYGLKKYG